MSFMGCCMRFLACLSLPQSFQFGELKSRERNSDTRERLAGFNSCDEAVKWKRDFSLFLAGRVFLGGRPPLPVFLLRLALLLHLCRG